jgi:hypothetical protein
LIKNAHDCLFESYKVAKLLFIKNTIASRTS